MMIVMREKMNSISLCIDVIFLVCFFVVFYKFHKTRQRANVLRDMITTNISNPNLARRKLKSKGWE